MSKRSEYNYSVPFTGNIDEAFRVAKTAMLGLGFEIFVVSDNEMHAVGPGMHSSSQPDLLGVSKIKLFVDSSSITACAVLGGAATRKNFICFFPPGLGLVVFLTLYFSGMEVSWLHVLWLLIWLMIAPWVSNGIAGKTIRAVEKLVRGMAQSK